MNGAWSAWTRGIGIVLCVGGGLLLIASSIACVIWLTTDTPMNASRIPWGLFLGTIAIIGGITIHKGGSEP